MRLVAFLSADCGGWVCVLVRAAVTNLAPFDDNCNLVTLAAVILLHTYLYLYPYLAQCIHLFLAAAANADQSVLNSKPFVSVLYKCSVALHLSTHGRSAAFQIIEAITGR